ncbi:MAG: alpha/beta fold hydrolase [Planctomycetes bacterium]|nr:alpha/beta fold hydrolase [Planctomycetota bacterium]
MKTTLFVRISLVLSLVAASVLPGCGGGGSEYDSIVPDTIVEETFTTQTADDWTIALHRYRRSSGTAYREPVLLSQGYLEGSKVFNAFPKFSLASKLALQGYDVWDYDIRGVGDSQKPEINWSNINFTIDWTTLDWSFGMEGWDYGMEHFVLLDTPAAMDFVLKATGAPQVIWIAHSLGALMQYAYLQTSDASKVKAAVSMGGIGYIVPGTNYDSLFADFFYGIGTFLAPLLPSNLPLPLKWALEKLLGNDPLLWAAASYGLCTVAGKLFWNYENMNPNLVYQFLKYSLPNTTTNCFKQFMEWAKTGDCKLNGVTIPSSSTSGGSGAGNAGFPIVAGPDGDVTIGQDYSVTQNLWRVDRPLLLLSGGADLMSAPSHSIEVYQRVSSSQKKYVECSKATGHAVDYGHVDMVCGLNANKEIYSHVGNWLEGYATRQ